MTPEDLYAHINHTPVGMECSVCRIIKPDLMVHPITQLLTCRLCVANDDCFGPTFTGA